MFPMTDILHTITCLTARDSSYAHQSGVGVRDVFFTEVIAHTLLCYCSRAEIQPHQLLPVTVGDLLCVTQCVIFFHLCIAEK